MNMVHQRVIAKLFGLVRRRTVVSISLGMLIAITLIVYAPGLRGDFMFDDFPNIVDNPKVQIQSLDWESLKQAWNSGYVGLYGRAMSMLSFGINNAITGLNAGAYKFVNLILHVLNGLLIFWLIQALLNAIGAKSRIVLPLWVTGVWLLHPINVTPVLLVVQRMTELATFFTLASLLVYLRLRLSPPTASWRKWLFWLSVPLLWCLGLLSKETAVLAPLFVLAIEFYVLRASKLAPPISTRLMQSLIGLTIVAALAVVVAIYLGWWIFSPSAFSAREFTLSERLMTETRVVWLYVKLIVFPMLSDFNLFHDGFIISRGWLSPWTTLLAATAWLITIALLVIYGRRFPLVGLGVAWFLIGHLLESTVLPLELIFEHRNYVPSIGLILAAGGTVQILMQRRGCNSSPYVLVVMLAGILSLTALTIQTAARTYAYSSPVRLYTFEATNNRAPRKTSAEAAQVKLRASDSLPT